MSVSAIPPLVALTADPGLVEAAELAQVAAALQKQVTRDFAPVWGTPATVAAFPTAEAVPHGYWTVRVMAKLDDPNALGYHSDSHRQPYAVVEHDTDWATTASHELLEMLADPWGNRLVVCTHGQAGRVRVLVEVCDPCEAVTYPVDGFDLSDFVLPHYYGPHRWRHAHDPKVPATTYCGGLAGQPLGLERGGYLSYVRADGKWAQDTWFGGGQPSTRVLGDLAGGGSLREQVDAATAESRNWIGAASDE